MLIDLKHGRTVMKTKRWLLFTAFVAVLVLVVACGGGGGGGNTGPTATIPTPAPGATPTLTPTPTPSAPSATGTVSLATGCTIVEDASTCDATVSYTTANNPTAPNLEIGTTSVATAASATNLSVTIGEGTFPVTLYDGTTVLDSSMSVTGVCDTDTVWDGTKCAPVVVHYSNVTVGVTHVMGIVDSTGFHPSVNKSTHTFGFYPVSGCFLPEENLPDGRIPILCQAASDLLFHVFALNPITNKFVDYSQSMPAGYEFYKRPDTSWYIGPKWHECQWLTCPAAVGGPWGTPPFPYMYAWAPDGKGGYYFVPGGTDIQYTIYEQDAAGNQTFLWRAPQETTNTPGVIVQYGVIAMATFSN